MSAVITGSKFELNDQNFLTFCTCLSELCEKTSTRQLLIIAYHNASEVNEGENCASAKAPITSLFYAQLLQITIFKLCMIV